MADERLTDDELRDVWPILSVEERVEAFQQMSRSQSDDFFLELSAQEQASIILAMPVTERRLWLRLLAPDDAVDLIQCTDENERPALLDLLDDTTRREVSALMAYAEDAAGGLMSPRFARLRAEMTVSEAVRYLQKQAQEKLETIYYAYVLDKDQHLRGVVSFRDLFRASGDKPISEVMHTDVVSVPETMDEEEVALLISRHDFDALPVLDGEGRMKGIVTLDDIVDVVQRAATEDIHKLGGVQALESPYMQTSVLSMVRKRAFWLSVLFIGEIMTASAMGHYEAEIARWVVLTLFVPLIISSGGNSGSQATTLIIRAMALGEVHIRDWWRIIRREIFAGLSLGSILGVLGIIRILLWEVLFDAYGEHYLRLAATVALSLVGVVTWGTLAGSMLPFVIRKLGYDEATASAPFVATLVDVSGLLIYFNLARLLMGEIIV
ncbi:MAG: magnesium transporter [Deltaproteobacteria bacterium]|nr:magnesium transporter [Deltaproteobacteria bacterium]